MELSTMKRRHSFPAAVTSTTILAILAACGGAEPSESSPLGNSTTAAEAATNALSSDQFVPGGNYVYAENVEEWLKIGRVDQAISGTVTDARVGPAVPEVDEVTGNLAVTNTIVLEIRVDVSFIGDAQPGDVVPVAMWAGSGHLVEPDAEIPLVPPDSGFTVSEFKEAFPKGVRVIAMSHRHPIEIMGGSNARPAVYPEGMIKQDKYMIGLHPQALTIDASTRESSWPGVFFDDLLDELRRATAA